MVGFFHHLPLFFSSNHGVAIICLTPTAFEEITTEQNLCHDH